MHTFFFILIKLNLSVFPFMNCNFGMESKSTCTILHTENFHLCASLKTLLSCFEFNSVIHFEFIVVRGLMLRLMLSLARQMQKSRLSTGNLQV